ncbi:hypothetical protein IG197_31850 (plasmid) [Aminobacter sp. SR38]|jgi:hypothetical protein|uniref:hypothetical protein n=1 Tax=Aminobacter sp. SR38 TaxID=2774562 RepID=UPI0017842DE2|nr:hypothetical protein [Aminobacter sp. SR38]QOF75183.1 hypothetical protein IG197_31850 [Aminobacter sp. SR38]
MKTCLIIAATITALTAPTAIAQTFETVDKSPAGDRFEKSANFDTLGFRPGDTIEDVKSKLKAEFPDAGEPREQRLKGKIATPDGAQVDLDFVNEISLSSTDGRNQIYVGISSQVYDNRALSIRRILGFDTFTTRDVFRKQIEEKYGTPSIVDDNDANSLQLFYLYADGRLISPKDAPRRGNRCQNDVCDDSKMTSPTSQSLAVETAQRPCAAYLRSQWQYMGTYTPQERLTIVKDDRCDGIMRVSMQNLQTELNSAEIMLVDVKRAYGHQTALDAAIEAKLKQGVDMDKVAKPRL